MNLNLKKPIAGRADVAKDFAEQGVSTGGRNAPVGYRRLTMNLEESLHRDLRIVAAQRGTTATAIIEALLKKHVVKQKKP